MFFSFIEYWINTVCFSIQQIFPSNIYSVWWHTFLASPKRTETRHAKNAERAPASPVFMENVRYRFRVSENSNMFNRPLHSHPLPARVKCCERMHDTTRILFVNIFLCFLSQRVRLGAIECARVSVCVCVRVILLQWTSNWEGFLYYC